MHHEIAQHASLPLPTTRHAEIRCQQRGIPLELVDLLFEFGEEQHMGHGATLLSFPKRCRKRLQKNLSHKRFAAIASRLDVYAVLSDSGRIMTVGHRYRPLRGIKN